MKCPSYSFGCKMKSMPKNMMTMVKGDIDKVEHLEGVFCAFEKSNCITEEKGCICGNCDVYKENELTNMYFCLENDGKQA
ncbi:DUF2769 domain-containing protein [Methanolobus sp. ZRKC3]|uniref:DUF2769 domain-containing protein n=1 Tax=Methanolobus sp. ZRKC3 TaxID=3125786 RepID=UPI00324403EB